jgi:hypothetical protein
MTAASEACDRRIEPFDVALAVTESDQGGFVVDVLLEIVLDCSPSVQDVQLRVHIVEAFTGQSEAAEVGIRQDVKNY